MHVSGEALDIPIEVTGTRTAAQPEMDEIIERTPQACGKRSVIQVVGALIHELGRYATNSVLPAA